MLDNWKIVKTVEDNTGVFIVLKMGGIKRSFFSTDNTPAGKLDLLNIGLSSMINILFDRNQSTEPLVDQHIKRVSLIKKLKKAAGIQTATA